MTMETMKLMKANTRHYTIKESNSIPYQYHLILNKLSK